MKYCDHCNKLQMIILILKVLGEVLHKKHYALDTKFNNEKDLSQRFYKMFNWVDSYIYNQRSAHSFKTRLTM